MSMNDTTTTLASDLEISKIVTGLWQGADMERDDRELDLEQTAKHMQIYADAGLTTFDMADHYGSAEDIAGIFTTKSNGNDNIRILTKWVPEPGKNDKNKVRKAIQRALDRLQTDTIASHQISFKIMLEASSRPAKINGFNAPEPFGVARFFFFDIENLKNRPH